MPLWALFFKGGWGTREEYVCLGWARALRQSLGQEVEQPHLPCAPLLRGALSLNPLPKALCMFSAGGEEDASALQLWPLRHPAGAEACSRGSASWCLLLLLTLCPPAPSAGQNKALAEVGCPTKSPWETSARQGICMFLNHGIKTERSLAFMLSTSGQVPLVEQENQKFLPWRTVKH